MSWRVFRIWKIFRVDNRDTLASVHVHKFFDYNGQHQISSQTRSPDSETIAP
jgi:hypothetical protein